MSHLNDVILDAYAEGQLSARERTAADAHLATCPDCRLGLVALAQMGDLLREQPRQAPPPELSHRILAELAPAPVPPVRPRWTASQWLAAGLSATVAWTLLVILVGETALSANRRGLGDLAELARLHPQVVTRYPSEALSAILESIPAVEVALTLVALALGLWLLTQIVAALPEGGQA